MTKKCLTADTNLTCLVTSTQRIHFVTRYVTLHTEPVTVVSTTQPVSRTIAMRTHTPQVDCFKLSLQSILLFPLRLERLSNTIPLVVFNQELRCNNTASSIRNYETSLPGASSSFRMSNLFFNLITDAQGTLCGFVLRDLRRRRRP